MRNYTGRKPFYQLWDENAFSLDTRYLHWQARLLYRALLQIAFYVTERPDLPDDDAKLALLIGCPLETWADHAPAIRKFFTPQVAAGVAVLRQKRLWDDWQLLEAARAKKVAAAEARWDKSESDTATKGSEGKGSEVKRSKEGCITDVMRSECTRNAVALPPSLPSLPSPSDKVGPSWAALTPARAGATPPVVSNGDASGKGSTGSDARFSADEQKITDASWERFNKIPPHGSVARLLQTFSVEQIVKALHSFADSQEDNEYAEYQFFQDGGCETVIRTQQSNGAK